MPVVCEEFEMVFPNALDIPALFKKWCKKLCLTLVGDPNWDKTGDFKVLAMIKRLF